MIADRVYYADLSAMRPLHPAWSLWLTDLFGLNVSLFAGLILMRSDSYREFKKNGRDTMTMWHEAQHRRQKLLHGYVRFALRYWFSRKWRAEWEREAYEVTTAMALVRGVWIADGRRGWEDWLVKNLSGWRYGWMMDKTEARLWAYNLLLGIIVDHERGAIEFIDDVLCPACGSDSDGCYCAYGDAEPK